MELLGGAPVEAEKSEDVTASVDEEKVEEEVEELSAESPEARPSEPVEGKKVAGRGLR